MASALQVWGGCEGVGAAGGGEWRGNRGRRSEGEQGSQAGRLKMGSEKRRGPEQSPSSQGPEREW